MGCPTPQRGIGAAQGKAPRSKTDLKVSSLCPSTCWVHSFVYNNNVYCFSVGFFIVVTDHFFRCIALLRIRNSNLSGYWVLGSVYLKSTVNLQKCSNQCCSIPVNVYLKNT